MSRLFLPLLLSRLQSGDTFQYLPSQSRLLGATWPFEDRRGPIWLEESNNNLVTAGQAMPQRHLGEIVDDSFWCSRLLFYRDSRPGTTYYALSQCDKYCYMRGIADCIFRSQRDRPPFQWAMAIRKCQALNAPGDKSIIDILKIFQLQLRPRLTWLERGQWWFWDIQMKV